MCLWRCAVAALLLAFSSAQLIADSHPFELRIDTVSAAPGQRVDVAVRFTPAGASASAIAFYVEYDATRLVFDPPASNAFSDAVFRSSYAMIESGERSMIGVCIYDPDVPLASLAAGPIAVLPFRVADTASGFAPVTITRPVDASDPLARKIDPSHATMVGGGVSIVPPAPTSTPFRDADRPLFADRRTVAELLVPSAPRIDAGDGSSWRTDLVFLNPEDRIATIAIELPGSGESSAFELAAGETRIFEDALADIFGLSVFSGAVVVRSSAMELQVRAIAHRTSGDGTITRQEIPVIDRDALFGISRPARLAGFGGAGGGQPRLTLVNRGAEPATLVVTARLSDGTDAGELSYTLAPEEVSSGIDVLSELGIDGVVSLEIRATDRRARFYAYASTTDGVGGNAMFQGAK